MTELCGLFSDLSFITKKFPWVNQHLPTPTCDCGKEQHNWTRKWVCINFIINFFKKLKNISKSILLLFRGVPQNSVINLFELCSLSLFLFFFLLKTTLWFCQTAAVSKTTQNMDSYYFSNAHNKCTKSMTASWCFVSIKGSISNSFSTKEKKSIFGNMLQCYQCYQVALLLVNIYDN